MQCSCQCIKSSSSCTAAKQVWNENTCGCDCKPAYQEHNLNCTGVSKVWPFYELIYLKQGNPWNCPTNEAFEFCRSLFADEYKTLPKSTRRNVKLNKFVFGSLWLPDLSCKHWFTSSVWNFCRWAADVVPCEKSPGGEERAETAVLAGYPSRWKRPLPHSGFLWIHGVINSLCFSQ